MLCLLSVDAQNGCLHAQILNVEIILEEDKAHQVAGDIVGVVFTRQGIHGIATGVKDQAVDHAADVRGENGRSALAAFKRLDVSRRHPLQQIQARLAREFQHA